MWFVSLPVQVAAVAGHALAAARVGRRGCCGLVGMVFESVGDAQLAAYKQDPDRPPVMDRGLWALDPAPELLRRRLRVVGHLAGRRPRRRLAARR